MKKLVEKARLFGKSKDPQVILERIKDLGEDVCDVLIALPGDIIVLRAGDHHCVVTCHLESNPEKIAMAIGRNFYVKEELTQNIRYFKSIIDKIKKK